MATPDSVRVGVVGSGYIAGVHSAAYRAVSGTYPDAPRAVELVAAADVDEARASALQRLWGWERAASDWQSVTRADDIDLVDICVPNVFHAEVAIDAMRHGKHVICEKPIAADVRAALEMCGVARETGRLAQVCFYYRLWPAIAWARELVGQGAIGRLQHFRGWMLQDYAANPAHDLGWRARRSDAGAGALGDLGSHIIDLARYLCGEIVSVCATTHSIVARQPATPDVDDLATMLVEFEGGTSGVLEASWGLPGHHCDLGFDLVCEQGGLRFSWERSNEIEVMEGDVHDPSNGHRRVLIGAGQPDVAQFISVPGQAMGYRDAFTIGVGRMMEAIGRGDPVVAPTFADGLAAALVVEGAQVSAADRRWVDVPPVGIA
jgi:predicted dehydrogenase